jgi:hypothetical protein
MACREIQRAARDLVAPPRARLWPERHSIPALRPRMRRTREARDARGRSDDTCRTHTLRRRDARGTRGTRAAVAARLTGRKHAAHIFARTEPRRVPRALVLRTMRVGGGWTHGSWTFAPSLRRNPLRHRTHRRPHARRQRRRLQRHHHDWRDADAWRARRSAPPNTVRALAARRQKGEAIRAHRPCRSAYRLRPVRNPRRARVLRLEYALVTDAACRGRQVCLLRSRGQPSPPVHRAAGRGICCAPASRFRYDFTCGQPPSFSGRNAWSPGTVPISL